MAFAYTTDGLTTATSIEGRDNRLLIHMLQMTLGGLSELSVEDNDFLWMRRVYLFALGECRAGVSLKAVAFSKTMTSGAE